MRSADDYANQFTFEKHGDDECLMMLEVFQPEGPNHFKRAAPPQPVALLSRHDLDRLLTLVHDARSALGPHPSKEERDDNREG